MKEQLINETEFGFRQVDESARGPKVTSRRPVGLLLDSQVTRLSARSDRARHDPSCPGPRAGFP